MPGWDRFNDIFICHENAHHVSYLQEPWVNTLFEWLRSLCFLPRQASARALHGGTAVELNRKAGCATRRLRRRRQGGSFIQGLRGNTSAPRVALPLLRLP